MLSVTIKGMDDFLKSFDPKKISNVASYAINDAARQTRTEASSAIREVFNLKKQRVDKEVRNISMSTREDLAAVIRAAGQPIGLTNFDAKWVRNVRGKARTTSKKKSTVGKRASKRQGVSVKIMKGRLTYLPHAFMGRGRRGQEDGAGSLHVFQRRDLKRWDSPIFNMASITIASMLKQELTMPRVLAKADAVLNARFKHHLKRLGSF